MNQKGPAIASRVFATDWRHGNPRKHIELLQTKLAACMIPTIAGMLCYEITTPFSFDDGDAIQVLLHLQKDGWVFTDNGHTTMHLGEVFEECLEHHPMRHMIERTRLIFGIEQRDGVFVKHVVINQLDTDLYMFLQGIIGIIRLVSVADFERR